ncbi:iron ABC transporter permease [Aureimonas fodinaquatilis]|uniref:Iron ABC transporter permease n=1 Tax=Aureimonas fodinaquatilis TaxID=2565783 RepID=A0A5B0DWH8_9HYPH|nr:iron ABC transporter permease [Aureimonas fodinaquatilis]KAA0970171.1 iron ABC transporter permease [Aureimonas fodinaquatilis]
MSDITEASRPVGRLFAVGMGRLAWIVACLWLFFLIALPILVIIFSSVYDEGVTLDHYSSFFGSNALLTATLNSLLVAIGIAVLSVVIGGPLAFGVARTDMKFKGLVRVTMLIALISPEFLLAMGYILLAGPNAGYFNMLIRGMFGISSPTGPLNIFSLWGLILTALPSGVAFVFLTLVPAFNNIDPALEEAARMKGASALRAIRQITIPQLRPAVLSGALLAFATSLAMYGPPQMLGINVLTVAIRDAMVRLNFATASVAAMVLISLSILALLAQRFSTRHVERYRTLGGKSFGSRTINMGWITHLLTVLGVVYTFASLVVPYGAMTAASLMKSIGNGFTAGNWTLDNYVLVFNDPSILRAATLSLGLATGSATLVSIMGVVVAYVILRTKIRGRAFLDYLSILPLAIPGTALAFALVVVYLTWPMNMLGFYGTPMILLVAYLARFIPLGVRNSQTTLLQIAPELEEASRVFGASEFKTLLRITVPLMLPAIVYTWLLVFIMAIPELSASVILRGFGTQTLSTALLGIWNGNGGLAVASAFGMTIFAVVGALFGLATFVARRTGAMRGVALS